MVWPLPRSLATTGGISVDVFSSPYLDVSVQAVPFILLFYSEHDARILSARVSPFGYPRIIAYLQLPEAFRSLSRPSSAPDAKAFPLRSFQLDHAFFSCSRYYFESCRFQQNLFFAKLFFTLNNFKVFHFRFVCQSSMISHLRLPSVALLFFSSLFSFQGAKKALSRPLQTGVPVCGGE